MSWLRCGGCGEQFLGPAVRPHDGFTRCPGCGTPARLDDGPPPLPDIDEWEVPRRLDVRRRGGPSIWPSFGGTLLGGTMGGGVAYLVAHAIGEKGQSPAWGLISLALVVVFGALTTMGFTALAGRGSATKGLTGGALGGGTGGAVVGGMVAATVLFMAFIAGVCAGAFTPDPKEREARVAEAEREGQKMACAVFGFCVAGGTLAGAISGLTGTLAGLAILASRARERLDDIDRRD